MKKTTTPELLMAFVEGDHEAFKTIFLNYYASVRDFVRATTDSSDDAEEICQEVFLKLWLNHQRVDPNKNLTPYLFAIVRHELAQFFRRRYPLEADILQRWENEPMTATSEEIMIAKETALLVELTVSRMPKQRKRIYQMSRVNGQSNESIARELNITKNAVEKQITYAMHDIRRLLITFFLFIYS